MKKIISALLIGGLFSGQYGTAIAEEQDTLALAKHSVDAVCNVVDMNADKFPSIYNTAEPACKKIETQKLLDSTDKKTSTTAASFIVSLKMALSDFQDNVAKKRQFNDQNEADLAAAEAMRRHNINGLASAVSGDKIETTANRLTPAEYRTMENTLGLIAQKQPVPPMMLSWAKGHVEIYMDTYFRQRIYILISDWIGGGMLPPGTRRKAIEDLVEKFKPDIIKMKKSIRQQLEPIKQPIKDKK